jgi:hypothetical protein
VAPRTPSTCPTRIRRRCPPISEPPDSTTRVFFLFFFDRNFSNIRYLSSYVMYSNTKLLLWKKKIYYVKTNETRSNF